VHKTERDARKSIFLPILILLDVLNASQRPPATLIPSSKNSAPKGLQPQDVCLSFGLL